MGRRDEPLELEDDDGGDAPRRPGSVAVGVYACLKWLAFGVGALLALAAFAEKNQVVAAATAGIACFWGIAARLAQAEQHRAAAG